MTTMTLQQMDEEFSKRLMKEFQEKLGTFNVKHSPLYHRLIEVALEVLQKPKPQPEEGSCQFPQGQRKSLISGDLLDLKNFTYMTDMEEIDGYNGREQLHQETSKTS